MAQLEAEIANGHAMRCLNARCGIVLMKASGCNWLPCAVCKTGHCWQTKKVAGRGPGGRLSTTFSFFCDYGKKIDLTEAMGLHRS